MTRLNKSNFEYALSSKLLVLHVAFGATVDLCFHLPQSTVVNDGRLLSNNLVGRCAALCGRSNISLRTESKLAVYLPLARSTKVTRRSRPWVIAVYQVIHHRLGFVILETRYTIINSQFCVHEVDRKNAICLITRPPPQRPLNTLQHHLPIVRF